MNKIGIIGAVVISAFIGVVVGLEVHKILVAVALGCALAVSSILFLNRRTPDSK
jgi:CBS-domain-containing membrane protein